MGFIYGVAQSRTRLKRLSSSSSSNAGGGGACQMLGVFCCDAMWSMHLVPLLNILPPKLILNLLKSLEITASLHKI